MSFEDRHRVGSQCKFLWSAFKPQKPCVVLRHFCLTNTDDLAARGSRCCSTSFFLAALRFCCCVTPPPRNPSVAHISLPVWIEPPVHSPRGLHAASTCATYFNTCFRRLMNAYRMAWKNVSPPQRHFKLFPSFVARIHSAGKLFILLFSYSGVKRVWEANTTNRRPLPPVTHLFLKWHLWGVILLMPKSILDRRPIQTEPQEPVSLVSPNGVPLYLHSNCSTLWLYLAESRVLGPYNKQNATWNSTTLWWDWWTTSRDTCQF